MIAPISNPAIPKTIAAPSPGRGGAAHESKVIPTAVVAKTRTAFCIRDLPRGSFGPGAKTKSNELPEGHGPLPGARGYLQRAAEAGSADAGYALGTTYDPSFIEKTGAQGIRGDFYRHGRGTSERRSSVRKPHKKGFGNWNRLGQWLPNGRMSRGRT